jgi:hypothetical protein
VHAYAFLAEGAVAPLSGFVWPTPKEGEDGVWVGADTAPRETLRGCRAEHRPYWLDDELWRIELGGTLTERGHVLLAERARLLGRVESWTVPLAWEFANACARRVAERAAVAVRDDGRADAAELLTGAQDLEELQSAATAAAEHPGRGGVLAGYAADVCHYARDAGVAARAACVAAKMTAYALAGDSDEPGYDRRVAKERAWQAAWLADRLVE